MKFAFTVQRGEDVNLIRACSDREIVVRDRMLRGSAILSTDTLIADWPPAQPAALTAEHLQAALALAPEVILIGTGARQYFPDPRVLAPIHAAGVGVEVMTTAAACRTYNILVQENRKVVAALIIEAPRDTGA